MKGRFIASAVLASLLYGLKYCAFGKRDLRCLDGFYLRLVKRVMHLPHDFHLSYAEAEARSGVHRPSLHLTKDRLRWTGHALRSDEKVLTEVLLFVPEGGRRVRGRPRLDFMIQLKRTLTPGALLLMRVSKSSSGGLLRTWQQIGRNGAATSLRNKFNFMETLGKIS